MQSAANNRLNVVPSIPEWYFTQFDYNKDISTKELDQVRWSIPYGQLQIKHLGTIFQIYPKGLPEFGGCIRFEGHYSTTEKNRLKDIVSDILDGDNDNIGSGKEGEGEEVEGKRLPFVTAEDLLKKMKENKRI